MILLMLFSLMFLMSSQPVFMVIILMMLTLMYSMFVMLNMGSFWFSYILMLVILSGIMVVFIYMASLIPNESFEFLSLFLFLMFIFMMSGNLIIVNDMMMDFISLKIWMYDFMFYNMFLIIFLLSVMLMVVWLSWSEEGAVSVSYIMCLILKGLIW